MARFSKLLLGLTSIFIFSKVNAQDYKPFSPDRQGVFKYAWDGNGNQYVSLKFDSIITDSALEMYYPYHTIAYKYEYRGFTQHCWLGQKIIINDSIGKATFYFYDRQFDNEGNLTGDLHAIPIYYKAAEGESWDFEIRDSVPAVARVLGVIADDRLHLGDSIKTIEIKISNNPESPLYFILSKTHGIYEMPNLQILMDTNVPMQIAGLESPKTGVGDYTMIDALRLQPGDVFETHYEYDSFMGGYGEWYCRNTCLDILQENDSMQIRQLKVEKITYKRELKKWLYESKVEEERIDYYINLFGYIDELKKAEDGSVIHTMMDEDQFKSAEPYILDVCGALICYKGMDYYSCCSVFNQSSCHLPVYVKTADTIIGHPVNFDSLRTLGTRNYLSPQIQIYPQPAKDFVFLESEGFNSSNQFSLLNITGRIFPINCSFDGNRIKLNTSAVPSGSYFLITQDKSGAAIIRKVIILRE